MFVDIRFVKFLLSENILIVAINLYELVGYFHLLIWDDLVAGKRHVNWVFEFVLVYIFNVRMGVFLKKFDFIIKRKYLLLVKNLSLINFLYFFVQIGLYIIILPSKCIKSLLLELGRWSLGSLFWGGIILWLLELEKFEK